MSLKPVVLTFMVKNMPEVQRVLRNVGDAMISLEQRSTAASRRHVSDRVREVEREASARIRAYERSERLAAAARTAGAKQIARTFTAEAEALSRSVTAKLAALEKLQSGEARARAKTLRGKISENDIKGLYGQTRFGGRGASASAIGGTETRKERDFKDLARQTEQWTKDAAREKKRAEQQAARDTVEAWRSAEREEVRARREGEREAKRIARAKARDDDRVEREKNHNAMRWVRQREREVAKEKKDAAARGERDQVKFRRTITGAAGTAMGAGLGVGAKLAHGFLGMGGGFSIEDTLQKEMALSGQAAGIVASSDTKLTADQVLSKARAVANTEGLDTSEVLSGFDEVKKLSGDLGKAVEVMPQLARIATATGANVGELGGLAGNIIAANPEISNEALLRQVRLFTQQGIVGGVEIGDMAKYGGRLTAGAQLFGGNLEQNEATLGAFAQIARQKGGAASAAEAAMGAQRFATDVAAKHDKLKKLGIETSDGHGKLRDPMEIMVDMISKTGGDVTKFKQLGLGERGIKPLTGAADTYKKAHDKKLEDLEKDKTLSKAEREKRSDAAGRQAVREEIFKFSNRDKKGNEQLTQAKIEEKAKIRLAQLDKQLAIAMNQLRGQVAEKLYPHLVRLTPVLMRMIPKFGELLNKLVGFIEWAERNPFSGFAAIVTAFFVKELAAAKIAQLIERAISGGGGGAGAAANAAGAGGALGTVGKGLAVVGAGIVAGAATKEWVDEGFAGEKKKLDDRVGAQIEAANLAHAATRGGLTDEQKARAAELTKQLRGDIDTQKDEMDPEKASLVKRVTGAFGAVVGGESFQEAQLVEQREQARTLKETQDALTKLVAALEKNTAATAAAAKPGGQGGGGGGGGSAAASPASPTRLEPISSPGRTGM